MDMKWMLRNGRGIPSVSVVFYTIYSVSLTSFIRLSFASEVYLRKGT